MTHHDSQRFEDVEFAHGTGAVFVQPGVHADFMKDVSAGDTEARNQKQRGRTDRI